MSSRYVVRHPSAVIALVGGVPKTVLGFLAAALAPFRVIAWGVSFDGIVATNAPVDVEFMSWDGTTGTGTETDASFQVGGAARGLQGVASFDFSVEPTNVDRMKPYLVRPDGGLVIVQEPLGREMEQFRSANGIVMRCNAAVSVNIAPWFEIEEG